MIFHHFAMVGTAAVSMGLLSEGRPLLGYYAPFYFGLIELSSLPLIVVDLFHPKHKEWNAYLTSDAAPSWLQTVNELARVCFAVTFTAMRTIWFPYVSFFFVLPDVWSVSKEARKDPDNNSDVPIAGIHIMATFNILFSCLQIYWGILVIRQIVKHFRPGGPSKTKQE
jgi:hypothetical protein